MFDSEHYHPGTLHVNAFTANWIGEENWLCPPVSRIGLTICHLKLCKAKGLLSEPVSPSAYF